ncbi:alpha/beta fold hydrolase [Ruegeria marina]|uniref:Pimeloyl-ACP methyl ester carboxylesterase n=1 Tax=Ruegeria marina TaxID=639004 RepID=A0A1G6Z0I1_9RHOB|nr:alpha/beta fold hydrolase [Ruegeria marina]SDD95417.1 Pimeloyl-ACP methyl ester carboxylesterase [Ruegeria marina]
MRPDLYDRVMSAWDDHLGRLLQQAGVLSDVDDMSSGSELPIDPELQDHFRRAHVILEQLGRKAPQSELERRINGIPGFVILAGADGKVRAAGRQARRTLNNPADVAALRPHLAAQSVQMLDGLLESARAGRINAQTMVLNTDIRPRHLIARVTTCPDTAGQLMIEGLDYQWTPAAERMLVASFGLSPAEVDIVRNLMDGRSLKEIAEKSRKSEHTVRNQTKSVLAKTGAPGQVDLIRLVAFLIDRGNQLSTAGHPGAVDLRNEVLEMRTGLKMQLYQCGAPDGHPVIYLHGMLDGMAPLEYLKPRFHQRGLRVLAPVRPGYGRSDPVSDPMANLEVMSEHVLELIDRFGLKRVAILGHMAGSVQGHVVCAGGDARIRGMVAVAGCGPILRREHYAGMARRQRIMAYTARWAPNLLPFFVRAGISLIDSENVQTFMDALYPPDSHERAVVDRLHLSELMHAGYRFAAQSGTDGFVSDSRVMVSDWFSALPQTGKPVIQLHGALDPVVPVNAVQEFTAKRTNVSFRKLDNVGQFLIYERPEVVLDAIDELPE